MGMYDKIFKKISREILFKESIYGITHDDDWVGEWTLDWSNKLRESLGGTELSDSFIDSFLENVSDTKKDDIILKLSDIYKHLLPSGNTNLTKFRTILNYIENRPDSFENTVEFIHKEIEDNNRKLNTTIFKDVSPKNSIETIINKIKYNNYKEYEDSFVGDDFQEKRTSLKLDHKIDDEDLIKNIVLGLNSDTSNEPLGEKIKNKSIETLNKVTREGAKNSFLKADLQAKKDIKCGGETIINKDQFVEVKKISYCKDSYLSEFFSIYKNPSSLGDDFTSNDNNLNTYNRLVNQLYYDISVKGGFGDDFIGKVRKALSGIMFDDNLFIPIEHIELYWSNRGQRIKDHRLSLRYRVDFKDGLKVYRYNKNEGTMVEYEGNLSCNKKEYVLQKGTNRKETMSEDFDWVKKHKLETNIENPIHLQVFQEEFGLDRIPHITKLDGKYLGLVTYKYDDTGVMYIVADYDTIGQIEYTRIDNELRNYSGGFGDNSLDVEDYLITDIDEVIEEFCGASSEEKFEPYIISRGPLVVSNDILKHKDADEHWEHMSIVDSIEEIKSLNDELNGLREELGYIEEDFETMEIQNTEYIEYGFDEPQHEEEDFERLENMRLEVLDEKFKIEDKIKELKLGIEEDKVSLLETLIKDDTVCHEETSNHMETALVVDGPFDNLTEAQRVLGFSVGYDQAVGQVIDDYGLGTINQKPIIVNGVGYYIKRI